VTAPESLPSLFPDLISTEGTAYKLRSGGYRPKPEVELVVIRLLFGEGEAVLKTFWWIARDERNNLEVAGGRLMVTNMRDAVAAARFLTKKDYRISRTREETQEEPTLTLEQWGHTHMDWLTRYALPDPHALTTPAEYQQSALF